MTWYFNACDVTVANSNNKICYNFFLTCTCAPTLKKVPSPMTIRHMKRFKKYLPRFICIVCSLYQCFSRRTKHIGTFLWISFSNNFMCSTRSKAFEACKNTARTDEPWFTKYEAVCFNKNVHWSVIWPALKPNWLSVVPRKGEILDIMKCSSSFDTTVATATGL